MPRATRFAPRCLHPASQPRTEFVAPAPDRFIRHDHAALEKQLFDVAQAQLKAKIPAHCAIDDAGWETVTVIERFRFLHRAILRH
jgi:hypothetical protein